MKYYIYSFDWQKYAESRIFLRSHSLCRAFKMLSDRFYVFLFLSLRLYSFCGFCPFRFDYASKLLVVSPHSRILIRFHLFNWICWTSFVFIQAVRFYCTQDLNKFNLNVTCTLAGILAFEIFLFFIVLENELQSFVNSTLQFARNLNGEFCKN